MHTHMAEHYLQGALAKHCTDQLPASYRLYELTYTVPALMALTRRSTVVLSLQITPDARP